ncbi:MAG: methylated-DNA--[protein]-cysteine S-methyltransferase [Phycisphaerales bacterium]
MLIKALPIGPEAPFGGVLAARTDGPHAGVCFLAFGDDAASLEAGLQERFPDATAERRDDDPLLLRTVDAVRQYAEHADGGAFDAIPVDLSAVGTEFQRRVWTALRAIPFGATRTYGQLAEDIGMTKAASRAVGAACGANPVALLVPCHRAIGASDELIGFAWGGVEVKRGLLDLESSQRGLFAG